MNLLTVIRTCRPSFLVLTPACVFLGLSLIPEAELHQSLSVWMLILVGAGFAHISVNMLNEYFDFRSELDMKTEKTAFSGGSGALPGNPEMAGTVFFAGLISLAITVVIGGYLAMQHSMQLIPVGVLGIILILTYTQWLNRSPLLCLIAPGLGFGVLMVVGTFVIINREFAQLPWLISLIPFFLVNNLLLLNQYPDVDADRSIGRNTFPIAFGLRVSNFVYALFMLAAYALILIYQFLDYIPELSIIALLPIVFALYAFYGAMKYTTNIGKSPRFLGANVAATISTIFLLGFSIFMG